jgi:hypothetical protein
MIPLDKRVKMLIGNYAKTIANMHPSKIEQFLNNEWKVLRNYD